MPTESSETLPRIECNDGERQITFAAHGHILTNVNVWSADSEWIVYDVRSDADGGNFDGNRIERVNVRTGVVEVLYASRDNVCCGVVTASPTDNRVVFIHGPEHPTPDWSYNFCHRRGVIVHMDGSGTATNVDACDLTPPFTAGALRGGSHVHVFSPDGMWIAFTYEDHVLWALSDSDDDLNQRDLNQRGVGVSLPAGPVVVSKDHCRNHDGSYFTVLVTRTVNHPQPGSDEISRAFEDGWVGRDGYVRRDCSRQALAIAFQGQVVTAKGESISEVFIVDLPEDLTRPGDSPLQGSSTTRPAPPCGVSQRRLTFTADLKFPGIQGPRHWMRSSPDGDRIAFLMKDDAGVVQIWTVSPNGGNSIQLTHNAYDIASTFTWSSDGHWIAHAMDGSVCVTSASTGVTRRLTLSSPPEYSPRPEACVFSPDAKQIAYVRPVSSEGHTWNQIFVCSV